MVANVLQGRIGPLTIPSLIQAVCGQKKTGTLAVKEGSLTKTLYLDAGRVIFASSNDEDDRLGTLFLRHGMISLHSLDEAAAVAVSGKRLGAALVDMKAIRPQDLIWGVTEQVKSIVIGLFSWTRGEYAFTGGGLPTQEVITLKMPTADLVLTGIKSIESWSRIRAAVGRSRRALRHQRAGRGALQGAEPVARRVDAALPVRGRCDARADMRRFGAERFRGLPAHLDIHRRRAPEARRRGLRGRRRLRRPPASPAFSIF